VLGAAALGRVPLSYDMVMQEPGGERVLAQSAASSHIDFDRPASASASESSTASAPASHYSFMGVASAVGNVVEDIADPAFLAFSKWRRELDRDKQAHKRRTQLASGSDADILGIRRGAVAGAGLDEDGRDTATVPVAAREPRVASIFHLFDRQAYWTLKDMLDRVNQPEARDDGSLFVINALHPTSSCVQAAVRDEVQRACVYVPRGPHRACYKLKPEFRTVTAAMPEENDGVV
jgi:hypothetical protein